MPPKRGRPRKNPPAIYRLRGEKAGRPITEEGIVQGPFSKQGKPRRPFTSEADYTIPYEVDPDILQGPILEAYDDLPMPEVVAPRQRRRRRTKAQMAAARAPPPPPPASMLLTPYAGVTKRAYPKVRGRRPKGYKKIPELSALIDSQATYDINNAYNSTIAEPYAPMELLNLFTQAASEIDPPVMYSNEATVDNFYKRQNKRNNRNAKRGYLPTYGLQRGKLYMAPVSKGQQLMTANNYAKVSQLIYEDPIVRRAVENMGYDINRDIIPASVINKLLALAYRNSIGYPLNKKSNSWTNFVKQAKEAGDFDRGLPASVVMQTLSANYRDLNGLPARDYPMPAGGYSAGGYSAGRMRRRSAWQQFVSNNFDSVQQANPGLDNGGIMSILGQMYRS